MYIIILMAKYLVEYVGYNYNNYYKILSKIFMIKQFIGIGYLVKQLYILGYL